ncbi:MAG: hypothetical protein MZV63_32615 [Marinilabiliales bacterium]|nr:hypothetical protein [Marinilabiliales bacterium]
MLRTCDAALAHLLIGDLYGQVREFSMRPDEHADGKASKGYTYKNNR